MREPKVVGTFATWKEAYKHYSEHGKPDNWEIEGEEPNVKIVEYAVPYCRRIIIDGKAYGVTWEQCKYIIPYLLWKKHNVNPWSRALFWSSAADLWKGLPSIAWLYGKKREEKIDRIPVYPCATGEDKAFIEKLYAEAKEAIEAEMKRRESPEYVEEREMFVKTFAERLMYPFLKEEARRHGFESIEAYQKWKEKKEREKNLFFMDFYVGEWDQNNIERAVRDAVENPDVMPKGCPDAVAFALMEYGYDFSEKRHHAGYKPVHDPYTGKFFYMYPPTPYRPLWAVKNIPTEKRDFPSHNYGVDRKIVESVLKRKGWTFGAKGWQPP